MNNQRLGKHYERYKRILSSSYNDQDFSDNNFTNVYNKRFNEQLSLKNEPTIEYDTVDYYLTISSKDRNTTNYPDVSKYSITLQNELRNIVEMELIQAIIPSKNNVADEPYLLLKIDEIENTMISNDRNIIDSFAILQMSPPTVNKFIHVDKRIFENTTKFFKTPKASLSKFTISLLDASGNLFDFNNSPGSTDKDYQNIFIFKIVCLEKKRSELNNRGVY